MKVVQLVTIVLIVLFFFTLSVNNSFATAVSWSQSYPITSSANASEPNTILQTADGGYLIGLSTPDSSYDNIGKSDPTFELVKTDSSGHLMWRQLYGGRDYIWLDSLIQTPDQGYILAGTMKVLVGTSFRNNVLTSYYNPEIPIVFKIDSSGQMLWNKTFSFHAISGDVLIGIIQTNEGGYALLGYEGADYSGSNGLWIVKTSADFVSQSYMAINNTLFQHSSFLIQSNDGGYVFNTRSYYTHFASLIKTDGSGNVKWNVTTPGYFNDNSGYFNDPTCVVKTNDDGYVFSTRHYLIKIDTLGNLQWNKTVNEVVLNPHTLIATSDGGFAMVNYLGGGSGTLVKTDSFGNVVINQNYGVNNLFTGGLMAVAQSNDGGYVLTGSSGSSFVLIKTDESGLSPSAQPTSTPTPTPTPTTAPTPTPTPTPTTAPTPTPSQTSTISPVPSPTVPEFPAQLLAITLFISMIIILSVVIAVKKRIPLKNP
jgi:hypothetical protein